MSFITSVIEWTKATFEPLGATGLFILAFIEASFFPIPPDLLLMVLALAKPELALLYALVATIGSTLGGIFGYSIGRIGGKPILKKFFAKKKVQKVHDLFEKYEVWAISIGGFSPLPYKVFAVAAGVFYIDLRKFIIATFFSRGARFFLEAILIMLYGEVIIEFLEGSFNLVTLVLIVGALVVYLFYTEFVHKKKVIKKKK